VTVSRPTAPTQRGARFPMLGLLVSATLLVGCGQGAVTPGASGLASPEAGALKVVATTTVLADMVARVGGSKVSVRSLVPKGGEVHTFDPTPATLTAIADAQLVVANGLGLDDALTDLVQDTGTKGAVIRLGEDLPGADVIRQGGEPNPHLWLNVAYARLYAARIAEAVKAAAPQSAAAVDASAAAYDARLAELDAWVKAQVASVPAANRKIISLHEAFPYFAKAYGLELVGAVVSTPGQDPSAGEIAALVAAIKASGARAIFSEAQFSDKLARTIADETGAKVESNLYNDTLGDAPADSFEGLIRWDVERIVAALK
jgi:ABC-type Zn uptake system ZnuABC Zn-binding protein ZnuA